MPAYEPEPSPTPQAQPPSTPAQPSVANRRLDTLPADAPTEDQGGRIRWGISGNLGWHLPQHAFTLGLEGRIGYQFSNFLSAYLAAGFTGGFGVGGNYNAQGVSVSLTALFYYYFGAIAEVMLGDLFYFGGGPVLANGALAGLFASGTSAGSELTTVVATGVKPGLDLRLGLGFGRAKLPSFRRGGFNLGLDGLILFHPDSTIGRAVADSSGRFGAEIKSQGLAVTLTPMLTLGYDAR